MLDLTSYDHRRGIVILTSKDMRVVTNNLFNWKVHTGCVEGYLDFIKARLNADTGIDDGNLQRCLDYIKSIEKWIKDASVDIDKCREVFH